MNYLDFQAIVALAKSKLRFYGNTLPRRVQATQDVMTGLRAVCLYQQMQIEALQSAVKTLSQHAGVTVDLSPSFPEDVEDEVEDEPDEDDSIHYPNRKTTP